MSRTEMPMFMESHEENTDIYRMSEDVHKAGIPKWIPWSVQLRHVNRSAIGPWRQDSLAPGCQLSNFFQSVEIQDNHTAGCKWFRNFEGQSEAI